VDKRSELIDKASLIPERQYGDFVLSEDHNNVISALELAQSQAEQVDIPLPFEVIWHCDLVADRIYELSVTDFSVIRQSPSPNIVPTGIGGDTERIWHADDNAYRLYELSTVDFSVIRSRTSPFVDTGGIGGNAEKVWYTDPSDTIYELSPSDLSTIREAPSPQIGASGIGGAIDIIWFSASVVVDGLNIYELSTEDFSVIRSAPAPGVAGYKVESGGDSNTIWHCAYAVNRIYELSVEDFSIIRESPSPSTGPSGIGGK